MVVPTSASGLLSFVHVDDAAEAVVRALETTSPSAAYNVADDEPITFARYVDLAAGIFGAPAAVRAPPWLLRLLAPVPVAAASVYLPLSNARARSELGWSPRYPTPRSALEQSARAWERGG
jgi:nucleoside-diphosphate-sugar epimerase